MSKFLLVLSALMSLVSAANAQSSYQYRVPLKGAALSAQEGQISVSPTQLSFADLAVGQASSSALVLQNTGEVAVALTGLSYSGSSAFLLDTSTCPGSLAASEVCAVGVSFAPQARGDQSGEVLIRFGSSQLVVPLSGRALQGELQADTGALVFDPVLVPGNNSKSLRIQNTGDASVSGINLSTQAPFSVSSGCSTIMPGDACELTLTFAPAAPGNFSEGLALSSPVGGLSVSLSGQGIAQTQTASLTPALLDFGTVLQGSASVQRSVTVTNTGNTPMSVTAVAGLPAGVTVQSNSCTSVQPSASCSISLSLATAERTEFSATPAQLSGPTNTPAVALTGKVAGTEVSVISGAPVSFGSVKQGTAAVSRIVTLTNTGNSPMSISGLSNLPASVTLADNTCSAIAPNNTCTLTLQMATTSIVNFSQNVATQGASTNASLSVTGAVTPAIADYTTLNYNWFSNRTPSRNVSGSAGDLAGNAKFTITVNGQTFTQSAYMSCSDGCDTNTYFDIFSATQAGAMGHSGNSLLYQLRAAFPTWSISNVDTYTIRINPPEGVAYSVSATAAAGRYGTGANLSDNIVITASP